MAAPVGAALWPFGLCERLLRRLPSAPGVPPRFVRRRNPALRRFPARKPAPGRFRPPTQPRVPPASAGPLADSAGVPAESCGPDYTCFFVAGGRAHSCRAQRRPGEKVSMTTRVFSHCGRPCPPFAAAKAPEEKVSVTTRVFGSAGTPPGSLRNPADRRESGARAPSVTIGAWRELGARAISLRDFPIFPPWLEPNPRFFLEPGRIVQCANYPCVFRGLIFSQMEGTFCFCVCARGPPPSPPPYSAGPKKARESKIRWDF